MGNSEEDHGHSWKTGLSDLNDNPIHRQGCERGWTEEYGGQRGWTQEWGGQRGWTEERELIFGIAE